MIGKFLSRVFIVVILFLIIYCGFSSIVTAGNGFIVVEDNTANRVTKVITHTYKGYSFVWEGCFPWWFSVYRMSKTIDKFFTVKTTFSELQELKDNRFYFTFPISITYTIDPEAISDYTLLKNNAKGLDSLIKKYVKSYLQKELGDYLTPVYARGRLFLGRKKIISIISDNVSVQLGKIGIKIKSFELSGEANLPSIAVYQEGLKFLGELRDIDKQNKKDLKMLQKQLRLNKLKNEEMYKKLSEISKIIKKNPDILKYIYIDKISSRSKLVSPIELPRIFDNKVIQKGTSGDIDNLR